MAYVTVAQLQTSLKTSEYDNLTDSLAARQASNIALADAEVNSYLSKVMGVPSAAQLASDATLAGWLRAASTAIAIHHAYAGKGTVPDEQVVRYKAWIDILIAVRDGDAIPPSDDGLPDATAGVDAERTGVDAVFTPKNLVGLI